MPRFQTLVGRLNEAFGAEKIANLVNNQPRFAQGQNVAEALASIAADPSTALYRVFRDYLRRLPGVHSETVRAAIYYALGTSPPTLITFAWAPSYDWEVTYWEAPNTSETPGGITVLFKSRYPDDKHPLAGGG
ncbi:MAG TPA: hypothetical protein VMU37_07725 [Caulobacteraceae bacterium]|nr:hypothetical protein [Caulobacteraceae bacterium]